MTGVLSLLQQVLPTSKGRYAVTPLDRSPAITPTAETHHSTTSCREPLPAARTRCTHDARFARYLSFSTPVIYWFSQITLEPRLQPRRGTFHAENASSRYSLFEKPHTLENIYSEGRRGSSKVKPLIDRGSCSIVDKIRGSFSRI